MYAVIPYHIAFQIHPTKSTTNCPRTFLHMLTLICMTLPGFLVNDRYSLHAYDIN